MAKKKIVNWRCAACHWVGHPRTLLIKKYDDESSDLVCPDCTSADIFLDDPVEWAQAAEINKSMKEKR